jgi:hypothetical protein
VSIVTTVDDGVFAVKGVIVTKAGAALRTGVEVTTTLAAVIVTFEISPIEIYFVFENAVEITELTLIIADGAMLPGKYQLAVNTVFAGSTSVIISV